MPEHVYKELLSKHGDRALVHLEKYPDDGHGECALRNQSCADVVENAIQHFENDRYNLYAHSVMPNHAHAIYQPIAGHALSKILRSWKSFSSKEINKILGRRGKVWQDKYFDHLIRSEKQLHNLIRYVAANPVKAKLKDWKWVQPRLEDL